MKTSNPHFSPTNDALNATALCAGRAAAISAISVASQNASEEKIIVYDLLDLPNTIEGYGSPILTQIFVRIALRQFGTKNRNDFGSTSTVLAPFVDKWLEWKRNLLGLRRPALRDSERN